MDAARDYFNVIYQNAKENVAVTGALAAYFAWARFSYGIGNFWSVVTLVVIVEILYYYNDVDLY